MSSAATSPSTCKSAQRVMGAICWNELHTRDTARAAEFYAKVVGWTPKTCDGAEGHAYTEWAAKNGQCNGGMMQMPTSVPAAVPANWAIYVNVADVDASLAKAIKLGGRKLMDPIDCPNVGRMCGIADPTGAVVHLFAGVGENGARPAQMEAGSFCWAELLTNDTEKSTRFYGELFGWTTSTMPMPFGDYTMFWVPGADREQKTGCIGGMMAIQPEMGQMPPNWLSYIMVEDVDAAAGRVTANGGTICCPPMDIPNVGRFCVFTDPTGATAALFMGKQATACGEGCGCE
jgi:predicted enzyme related to lactoylglutathione lyase